MTNVERIIANNQKEYEIFVRRVNKNAIKDLLNQYMIFNLSVFCEEAKEIVIKKIQGKVVDVVVTADMDLLFYFIDKDDAIHIVFSSNIVEELAYYKKES